MLTMPIVHVVHCPAAECAVLIGRPYRYTITHGEGPHPSTHGTEWPVRLVGALGDHVMLWASRPSAIPGVYEIVPIQGSDIEEPMLESFDAWGVRGNILNSLHGSDLPTSASSAPRHALEMAVHRGIREATAVVYEQAQARRCENDRPTADEVVSVVERLVTATNSARQSEECDSSKTGIKEAQEEELAARTAWDALIPRLHEEWRSERARDLGASS